MLHGRSDTVADAVAEVVEGARGHVRPGRATLDRRAVGDVGPVDRLALVAIDRDQNTIAATTSTTRSAFPVTLKLVGYAAVVSALRDRLTGSASIVLFGGMAKERPTPARRP